MTDCRFFYTFFLASHKNTCINSIPLKTIHECGSYSNAVSFTVPDSVPTGEYKIQLGIKSNDLKTSVYLCTDAEKDGDFFTVGSIKVD